MSSFTPIVDEGAGPLPFRTRLAYALPVLRCDRDLLIKSAAVVILVSLLALLVVAFSVRTDQVTSDDLEVDEVTDKLSLTTISTPSIVAITTATTTVASTTTPTTTTKSSTISPLEFIGVIPSEVIGNMPFDFVHGRLEDGGNMTVTEVRDEETAVIIGKMAYHSGVECFFWPQMSHEAYILKRCKVR